MAAEYLRTFRGSTKPSASSWEALAGQAVGRKASMVAAEVQGQITSLAFRPKVTG